MCLDVGKVVVARRGDAKIEMKAVGCRMTIVNSCAIVGVGVWTEGTWERKGKPCISLSLSGFGQKALCKETMTTISQ